MAEKPPVHDVRQLVLGFLAELPERVREHSYMLLAMWSLGTHAPPESGGYEAEVLAQLYDSDGSRAVGATLSVVSLLDYILASGIGRAAKLESVMADLHRKHPEDEFWARRLEEAAGGSELYAAAFENWTGLRSDALSTTRLFAFEESLAGLGAPMQRG